jgi:hypothetical protein
MPGPEGNPDFEFQECHGHFHFKGFASYRLLDAQGQPLVLGRKVSFCLLDVQRWDLDAARDCAVPLLSTRHSGGLGGYLRWRPAGQWIDVTGIPDGSYTVEVTLNPERKLLEADYTNNTEQVVIELSSTPSGARAVQFARGGSAGPRCACGFSAWCAACGRAAESADVFLAGADNDPLEGRVRFLWRSLWLLSVGGTCALGGGELEQVQRELRARQTLLRRG